MMALEELRCGDVVGGFMLKKSGEGFMIDGAEQNETALLYGI
jgi:hypothetical protein